MMDPKFTFVLLALPAVPLAPPNPRLKASGQNFRFRKCAADLSSPRARGLFAYFLKFPYELVSNASKTTIIIPAFRASV
jgi:hypothetical protein